MGILFLIGTNGGGDYYSLRLDDAEGVWLIGSDCGETPTRVAETLQQYVELTIAEHVPKTREAERVSRLRFRRKSTRILRCATVVLRRPRSG